MSEAKLSYIIRDFKKDSFENRKNFIKQLIEKYNALYENIIELDIHDEYYNMSEIIDKHFEIIDLAKKAMLMSEVKPIIQPIRGGTDGARLSFMGLPCPNIFAGGHNFHGPYEFVPISSMEKAVEVIINIIKLAAE